MQYSREEKFYIYKGKLHAESEKAWKIQIGGTKKRKKEFVWLPKSRCEAIGDSDDTKVELRIPDWLVDKNDLWDEVVEEG